MLTKSVIGNPKKLNMLIKSNPRKPGIAGLYALAIFFVVFQIYPIFWVAASSFKTSDELSNGASYALPKSVYLGNYIDAFTKSDLPRYFWNSTVVAIGTLVLLVLLGCPAAFAISKLKFKQSNQVLNFFLFGMMIPAFVCLIPMFRMYNAIGLRNTYLSLIIPQVGFGLPLCIYLYTGFLNYVPNAILEAAVIDGASAFQIFRKIIIPMAKNSTVTIIIYNFVNVWNEFTYANTFMTKGVMKTLPIGLNDFIGEMGVRNWGATFAAIVIAILPTTIIYFILNKQVMAGMAAGAVKN